MRSTRRLLRPCLAIFVLLASGFARAAEPRELPLWPGPPPGMVEGATPGADDGTGRWRNVGIPGLLLYQPDGPAPDGGLPVLIACPGGGYTHLTRLVGADGAVEALLPKGFVIVSLKYRTRGPSVDVEADALADGERAVRLVRHHAADWGVDPRRVGLVGWSAGANLALNVACHGDAGLPVSADPVERESSRPDFVVMLCPWPARRTIEAYPIPRDAPPAFIASAEDDKTAPIDFARGIAAGYASAGATHHLWTVAAGGHGAFTIGAPGEGGAWIDRFLPWLAGLPANAR